MGKLKRETRSKRHKARKTVSHQSQSQGFLFGIREAQKDFSSRHQQVLREYSNLRLAQDFVISGATKKMKHMTDKIIYFLSRQVFEDFDEILLLCGNGMSTGALKILRGMFERTVTVCYLQKHPEDVERYHKYYYVRRRKETSAVKRDFPNALSVETLAQYEKDYEDVKSLFQVPVCEACKVEECKHCKKLRDNHTWIRKDIIQLAREAENFEAVVWIGYYVPMQESHPTAQAITHRVEFTKSGKWNYVEGPKPDMDRNTFMVAHFLVIRAVEALGRHLNMDLEPMLENLWKVYMEIVKEHTPPRKQSVA